MKNCIIFSGLLLFSCVAATIDEQNTDYYWDNSIDNNETYFKKVSKHCKKVSYFVDAESITDLKSSIFFASIPPMAKVYIDTIFLGTANTDKIYYKPGTFNFKTLKPGKELLIDQSVFCT